MPAGLGRLFTPQRQLRLGEQQQHQQPLQRVAAQNMAPQQLTRPGQSQRRWLASHTGPTSLVSGAPPPPCSEEALSASGADSAAAAISLPAAAATNPSTAQLRSSSLSRTAQIAQHLQHTRSYTTASTMASPYTIRKVGAPYTLDHRVYIEKDGVPISPFHDIPLYANQEQTILNMVVEIPRWTNAKQEVC